MFCSKCGNENDGGVSFCRRCGTGLENSSLTAARQNHLPGKNVIGRSAEARSKDPDELSSSGVGSVIVGDGFFMVAVILSATESAVSSLLWLSLLIPAFYCFGRGFADLLLARQIRRRQKHHELDGAPGVAALPPPRASVVDIFKKTLSGELTATPSVTERTTRDLQ